MNLNTPTDLQIKIGQLLLFGWQGETPAAARAVNSHAAALIDELAVGGVILMGRNVGSLEETRAMLAEMQELAAARGLPPLFVATDQEGGRVSRFIPPHYTRFPVAKTIGDTADFDNARQAARAIAQELKAVGLNWDFAPVLDVNNNPKNPVIGDRSYGDDPDLVAKMGVAAVRGFQDDAGLLACGKHFPGHGDTEVDSHLALPTIGVDRARLDAVELVPFRAAIAAGLAGIMTSHILFTELDAALPATLSPTILTGILRGDLGYEGLIITDCLEMKGVADQWGSAEASVLALEAGADILLCCHTWETQVAIRDAVTAAVRNGRITEARIEESLARIAAAKKRWISKQNVIAEIDFAGHRALSERVTAAAAGE
ncbi:MAG: beta-glucosidase-related glycosidase [Capsulimonas sp.]|jgi:beta-N-acetylhexosaminidase|nr:beta-glucosidase-related glycosidase [Capsulimonas sp.]